MRYVIMLTLALVVLAGCNITVDVLHTVDKNAGINTVMDIDFGSAMVKQYAFEEDDTMWQYDEYIVNESSTGMTYALNPAYNAESEVHESSVTKGWFKNSYKGVFQSIYDRDDEREFGSIMEGNQVIVMPGKITSAPGRCTIDGNTATCPLFLNDKIIVESECWKLWC
jgi:hypothetical protein